ncbi:MAG: NAD(P)H-binding protein [Candidatus Scalindua sp.]
MKILVTGGTGFTGRRVLSLLEGRGQIRCLVRSGSMVTNIEKLKHEVAYGDLSDQESLAKAMIGCEALINIASMGFGHIPGIVRCAENAGIKRVIFISTTAIFTHLNTNSKSIRQEAEDCVMRSSLEWTILRPTMIYGTPEDRNMIRLIRFIDHLPLIPVFGSGNYLQQPVHVEDVAKSIVAVLFNRNTIKKEFNISGKFSKTYNEIVDITANALGKKITKIHMPYKLSIYLSMLYEKFSTKPFLKREQIMRLNENKEFDHTAARKIFGFNPISFEEGIAKEVTLYRQYNSKNTTHK